jgi:anti-sigma regulatory factor (Ser/Thr protein kinase)
MTEPVEFHVPREAPAPALARRTIDEQLKPDLSDQASDDLKLITSELVANALVHGAGEITVRLDLLDDAVRVEVIDEGVGSTPAIREGAGEDGGWGLRIVESLSRRWGVFEGSAHVWAEIAR